MTKLAEKPKPEQVAGADWQTGDAEFPYVGSMGIYLFKREALERLLADEPEAAPVAAKGAPAPPGGSDVHFGYVRVLCRLLWLQTFTLFHPSWIRMSSRHASLLS